MYATIDPRQVQVLYFLHSHDDDDDYDDDDDGEDGSDDLNFNERYSSFDF